MDMVYIYYLKYCGKGQLRMDLEIQSNIYDKLKMKNFEVNTVAGDVPGGKRILCPT